MTDRLQRHGGHGLHRAPAVDAVDRALAAAVRGEPAPPFESPDWVELLAALDQVPPAVVGELAQRVLLRWLADSIAAERALLEIQRRSRPPGAAMR